MLDAVRKAIGRRRLLQPGDRLAVGVSGGPDSLCLLHLLTRLQPELQLALHVAHLNHGLRGKEAEADAEFVRLQATEWGLPATIAEVHVDAQAAESGMGVEEAARQARYAFLVRVAGEVGAAKIAVGHNADDQAETVLMHLLRGAGLAGLRGMLATQELGDWLLAAGAQAGETHGAVVTLIRPLLEVTRAEIDAYCRRHRLKPRLDRTNLDVSFHRNRLRHEVLPSLEEVSPGLRQRLCQLAELASADHALLESALDERWANLIVSESSKAIWLDLAAWRGLPLSLRRSSLRRGVRQLRRSLRDLAFGQVEGARRVAEEGETGVEATLPGGLRLSVAYDRLLIAPGDYVAPPPPDWPMLGSDAAVTLALPGRTALPGSDWQAEVILLPADPETYAAARANPDRWQAFLDADLVGEEIALRPRRSGERFQPLGMGGQSSSVTDFMINNRIPAGWRDRVPILAQPEHLLWVAGWRLDERAKVTERTNRVLRVVFARG